MKVIEIFDSIDGEGIRTGQCATFIRLAGCNLRCSYCDTVYSLFGEETPCEYTEMTVDDIISKVNMTYKRVTLTGGEPLVHTDSAELVLKLTDIGCDVNIETNGAVDIVDFLGKVPKSDNLFFTIDYKLPSSGMTDKMIWNNFIMKSVDFVSSRAGGRGAVREMAEKILMSQGVWDDLIDRFYFHPDAPRFR